MGTSPASASLEKEVGRFLRRFLRLLRGDRGEPPVELLSPEAFRAVVAQRLRALEREAADTRTRINGLLFVVLGAVITQIVMKML